jgi:hypothetical protein
MIQYERIETYIEGRKRYKSFEDPDALDCYLQVRNSDAAKFSMRGTSSVFANHMPLVGLSGKLTISTAPEPFERSRTVKSKFLKTEPFKRSSLADKCNNTVSVSTLYTYPIEHLKAPICICIISKVLLMKKYNTILKKLNERASHFLQYPLEVYIKYLTSAIPIPPRGFYKLSVQLFDNDKLELLFPPPNTLPICDIDFLYLARSLSPDNIVKAMNYIILERHVLFISNNIETLTPVIEALLALMYPFEYQLMYLPVVPYKLIDVLQTSCPYLLGLHRSLFNKFGRYINSSVCVIDLDYDTVSWKEVNWVEADTTLYKHQVEFAVIPKHETDKAIQRITQPLLKLRTLEDLDKNKEEQESLVDAIRNAFFLVFVSVFKQQDSFIKKKNGEYRISGKKLLSTVENDYKWFILQFSRTSICNYWLESKSYPGSFTKAYEHLFFDESIKAKLNRSSTFFKKVLSLLFFRVLLFSMRRKLLLLQSFAKSKCPNPMLS